jgi:hypothetical protein
MRGKDFPLGLPNSHAHVLTVRSQLLFKRAATNDQVPTSTASPTPQVHGSTELVAEEDRS